MFKQLIAIAAITTAAVGCAKSSQSAATMEPFVAEQVVGPETTKIVVGELGHQVGVDQKYVSTALEEASKRLTPETQTAFEKEVAAKRGVEKAVNQAASEGTIITDTQKAALIDGIKKLL
jgi:hypothetical protein